MGILHVGIHCTQCLILRLKGFKDKIKAFFVVSLSLYIIGLASLFRFMLFYFIALYVCAFMFIELNCTSRV